MKPTYRILSVLMCCAIIATSQAESKHWIRYSAISPDGAQIAFCYRGDLWIVPTAGGDARLLTTHANYEKSPIWSPDSKQIVFASDRHGNQDLFMVAASGGSASRLTFHSSKDTPTCFTSDGKEVLFTSYRQDHPQANVPHSSMSELYAISVNGGRPRQLLTTPAEEAVMSEDGKKIAYHDYKGYEDTWRKHHVSAVARDVWLFDATNGEHSKLTNFRGEDRDPVWGPDDTTLYFLSERDGPFNVWKIDTSQAEPATRVTDHKTHPVRFLSIAEDGTLAYCLNGQVWVRKPDSKGQPISINISADNRRNPTQDFTFTSGASEFAVSQDGDEVAFVIRGEVFVASVEYGTTKRITDTPQQERSVVWGPKGRTVYYAGERDGAWNLYQTKITRDEETQFSDATILTEEPVLVGEDESFQPVLSPDGKKIAYLHNRDEIRVLDLATKKTDAIVPAERNYSYSDGDIQFSWSPDSRWLAFNYLAHQRWLEDVGLANLATGKITNITNSGYFESRPRWSKDGKSLLFISDRFGRRSHGSWGSDDDVLAFYLTRDAWEWIKLSEEELKRRKKREEKKKDDTEKDASEKDEKKEDKSENEKQGDKKKSRSNDAAGEEKDVEPLTVNLDDINYRIKRLTLHSSPVGGFDISPDGEKLVYFARVENVWDLWICKIRSRSTYKLAALGATSVGEVEFSQDGKSVFVRLGKGKLSKVTVPDSGAGSVKSISFKAKMRVDFPAERAYIFEHAWRQVKRKFYTPDLHGVDWDAMKQDYSAFLPSVATTQGFAELLSEMLGELNASHTGGRYRPDVSGDRTASLGLLFDPAHRDDGLKVAEVLRRGPADRDDSKISNGTLITHINGERIESDMNPFRLLNNLAGQKVRLGLSNPESNQDWEEIITPISRSQESELLYERWIKGRRELTEKLSSGRVGYVHVRSMNDSSFRRVYKDVLGINSDKKALIVDTRYNGGGWLHDDLVSFLGGQDYLHVQPRGKKRGDLGSEPAFRWSRPVAVVQSEGNYSDAHMFPYAFKQLKLGRLIGTPVAGTGTAVWWEKQINPTLIFGIPQVGMVTPEGKYLENLELKPDVEVYNTPESIAAGKDLQIEKAVETLLKDLE